jgi:hypothetical protein
MDYVIAIPSYRRANLLRDKTLTMLRTKGIPRERIFVFVANQEEHLAYQSIDPDLYNEMIIGVVGLVAQRQFITDYYPEGKHIIQIDDDVSDVDLTGVGVSKFKDYTLDEFFRYAFNDLIEKNAYIWGIYPVYNPFFRHKNKETTDCLTFIVGTLFGYICRHSPDLHLSIAQKHGDNKEDVERSILFFLKDGKTVRYNKIGIITKFYGVSGGMGNFKNRLSPMLEASKELQAKYGEMGRIKTRKTGMTEFVLKWKSSAPCV